MALLTLRRLESAIRFARRSTGPERDPRALALHCTQVVQTSGAKPSARSGLRTVGVRSSLLLFGGFSDSGRHGRYYNDLYSFDTPSSVWSQFRWAPCQRCLFCSVLPVLFP